MSLKAQENETPKIINNLRLYQHSKEGLLTFNTFLFSYSHVCSIQIYIISSLPVCDGVWLFLSSSLPFGKKKREGKPTRQGGVLIHIQPKVTQHDRMILYLAGRVRVFGEGGSEKKKSGWDWLAVSMLLAGVVQAAVSGKGGDAGWKATHCIGQVRDDTWGRIGK